MRYTHRVQRRILLASDLQERGGAAEALRLLARYLPHERFSVTVALPVKPALDTLCVELESYGCGIERLAHSSARDPRGVTEFASIVQAATPDLVHAHLAHSGSCRSLILGASARRIPVVTTEHDPFHLPFFKRLVKRLTLRKTARTIAVSDATREFLIQEYGLPSSAVTRIWNGIEVARMRGGAVRTAELEEYRSHAPLILTDAALHHRKGLDVLIEAMRTVLVAAPNALSLIIGNGPDAQELRDLVAARGVGQSARFLGWPDNLVDLLATCDMLVQPSRREAFGIGVIQAMAAGKPVVATQVGGHVDTIEQDITGILVPAEDPHALANAILALASDPARRASMGAAGSARADAHFTAERMATDTAALYDDVLAHA